MGKEYSHIYRALMVRKNAALLVFRQLRNRDWNEDEGLYLGRNEWSKAPKRIETDQADFAERWDREMHRILSGKPYTEYFEEHFVGRVTSSNPWDVVRSIEFEMQHHNLSDSIDLRYLINLLRPTLETAETTVQQTVQKALEWLEQQEASVRAWEQLHEQTQLVHVKYIKRSYFPSRFLKDIERLPVELTLNALETDYRLDFRFDQRECEHLLNIVTRQLVLTPSSQKLIAVQEWIKTWLEALTSPHRTEYLTNSDGRKGYYNKAVAERLLKVAPFWKWEHTTESVETNNLQDLLAATQVSAAPEQEPSPELGMELNTTSLSEEGIISKSTRSDDESGAPSLELDQQGLGRFLLKEKDTLIPFLEEYCKGSRPIAFAYLIHALHELNLIKRPDPEDIKLTELYQALKQTFSNEDIGSYENLRVNTKKLFAASWEQEKQIKKRKDAIQDFLKSMTPKHL